jgi:hypothetical protein
MIAPLLLAPFLLAPMLGASPTFEQREVQSLADRLDHARTPVEAASLLYQIETLLPHLGNLAQLAAPLERAAARSSLSGEASVLAQRLSLSVALARGRTDRAGEIAKKLNLVTSFSLKGPIDWHQTDPCGTGSPVPSLAPGPPGEAGQWRAVENLAPTGRLNLDDLVSDRRDVAALIAFTVVAHSGTDAAIYYGTGGPSALAVNGRWVARDGANHPERPDQLRAPVHLNPGPNVVLLQLCRTEGPLQISMRVAAHTGAPLAGVELRLPVPGDAPKAAAKARPSREAPEPIRGGLLLAEARRHGASGLGSVADLIEALQPFDRKERRAAAAREKACTQNGSQECFLRLASDFEQARDLNSREAALGKAAGFEPESTALALARARLALDLGYPERALQESRAAAEKDPGDYRLVLLRAQATEALGLSGLAGRAELEGPSRWTESPDVLMAAAYRNERLHRDREAVALLRVLVGLRDDLLGTREALKRLLLRQRDLDGALDQLAAEQRILPASPRPFLEEGSLLFANPGPESSGATARRARAEAALERASALAPFDAEVQGEIASILLRNNVPTSGRAALTRALGLRPQSESLRSLDQALAPAREAFATPYLVDLLETARRVPTRPGEDAVVLSDVTATKVYPSGLSSRVRQVILRVQTDRGADSARVTPIEYSPERQELHIEAARILKPDGRVLTTHQEATRSLSEPWYDLYYDHRADEISFPGLGPGDVLELRYRLDDTARENLLANEFGDLVFLQDTVIREQMTYVVLMPPGRPLIHNQPAGQELKLERTPQADGSEIYRWSVGFAPKLQAEPAMPGWAEVAPYLHVSTEKSWPEVGRFYWSLVRDQLAPTPALTQLARKLQAAAGPDPKARVEAAYDYVVSQTRYVGLEFGINGYKPYPVGEVLARGFGDCKEKASLLLALLREMGIDSRLVLLRTRRMGRIGEEPASLAIFNHAILYVPSLDRYLDGTARFTGADELPGEDQGASGLIVEPDGPSRLVTTPQVDSSRNQTVTSLEIRLRPDGSASVAGDALVSGVQAPDYRRSYQSELGRRTLFEQAWSRAYPGLSVEKLELSDVNRLGEAVRLTFQMSVPRFAQAEGSNLVFDPFGSASTYVETYAPLSRRTHDLVLPYAWTHRFDYHCQAPAGYRFATPPGPIEISGPFGKLELRNEVPPSPSAGAPAELRVVGSLRLSGTTIPSADYAAFRSFLGQADRAFAQQLQAVKTDDGNVKDP